MLETPLKAVHEARGAKMVDFAGWNMPVWYSSSTEEHNAVRERVGLFDLGHMGRLDLAGPGAKAALNALVPADLDALEPGQAKYSFFLTPDGTYIDDILIYTRAADAEAPYFLVVNASNREPVLAHLAEHLKGEVEVRDRTMELAMLAIQGPAAIALVDGLCEGAPSELAYYTWGADTLLGCPMEVARTGYTGEDGVEIYFPAAEAERVWSGVLEAGAAAGIAPCGLAARDTLRLEAGMALYGHEIDRTTNPVEARASWAVAWDKQAPFLGDAAIRAAKENKTDRLLVGLEVDTKRVPRQGQVVLAGEEEVGVTTSGCLSPTLGKRIAMAYVRRGHTKRGTELTVDVRGTRSPATVVKLPFYKRPKN